VRLPRRSTHVKNAPRSSVRNSLVSWPNACKAYWPQDQDEPGWERCPSTTHHRRWAVRPEPEPAAQPSVGPIHPQLVFCRLGEHGNNSKNSGTTIRPTSSPYSSDWRALTPIIERSTGDSSTDTNLSTLTLPHSSSRLSSTVRLFNRLQFKNDHRRRVRSYQTPRQIPSRPRYWENPSLQALPTYPS
jgi:hypothetical protein